MNMKMKLLFFSLIYVMCTFEASADEEKEILQKHTNTHFMKIREKFDFLFDKVEKLENSTGDNTQINATQIMNAMEKILAKFQKFEERLDALDKIPKKIIVELVNEQFDQKFKDNRKPEIVNERSEIVCKPNPCLNGEHCRATSTGGYQCTKCPYPTSGKFCEHLDCGAADQCFQLNGIMYFVHEKRLRWDQANRLCVENGMNLALLKDKSTTDPVMYTLKAKYNHYPSALFWLGLKNNGNGRSFQWIDGSAFGGYTGAAKPHVDFKHFSDERCGILFFLNGNLLWHAHNCNWLNDPHQHYPLCELHLVN